MRVGARSIRRAAAALGVSAAAVAGAAATAGPDRAGITFAGAGCPHSFRLVSQSITGRISGCIRLGALRNGPHVVLIEDDLGSSALATKVPRGLPKQLRKFFDPKEPPVRLTLSPAAGPPGTRVRVTGHLLAPAAGHGPRTPIFCWDGCQAGLQDATSRVRWVSPRTFGATLRVPAAPWVENFPARVIPLVSGTYPISVQCVVFGKACAAERPEGTARFDLRAAAQPGWCRTISSCAQLRVSPAAALPGDVVKVTGYAPLSTTFGGGQQFGVQIDVVAGRPHGAEVQFRMRKKAGVIATFGHGALTVLQAPAYTALRGTAPIAALSGGLSAITAPPADPSTVAWCGLGAVGVLSGGAASTVPTAGVAAALAHVGFQPAGGSPPSCDAVAPAGPSASPASTIVAAFAAAPSVGAPPFYEVALVTRDRGATWSALPVPSRSLAAGFGGFRYTPSGAVEAVFAAHVHGGTKLYPAFDDARPVVELTADGGATWSSGRLGCPAAGPCVTLGPYAAGNCAKGLAFQALLRSADGGRRWRRPALPDQIYPCGEVELVATAPRTALLVNSLSPYTVQRSTDGAITWSDVALPRAPGAVAGDGFGPGPGGVTVLSNGSLLLSGGSGYRGAWLLLGARSRAWCRVRTPAARVQHLPQLTPLTVIGSELWWLTGLFGQPPAVNHVAQSALSCR